MKKFFPILSKSNLIFADNAAGSQIPSHVLNRLNHLLTNNYVQPNYVNNLSQELNDNIKDINYTVNTLFNNKNGKIIYGNSCTQIIYNLVNSLEKTLNIKNSNIILSNFTHESCITPFERLANKNDIAIKWWTIKKEKADKTDKTDNYINYNIDYNNLLEKIDNNTSLVVIPHVSNVLGNILDVKNIIKDIKKINKNTRVLVDGVAYFPHRLLDVNDLNVDYYVVSFYKFCGLRISCLYLKDDCINIIDNINHTFFDTTDNINKKLELGGMNHECASSILGLKDYLIDVAKVFNYKDSRTSEKKIYFDRKLVKFVMEKIYFYEKMFLNNFKNFSENIENNEIEIIEDKTKEKIPIFSLKFKNYNENNISLILNSLEILCNNGTFYCDRLFEDLKIDKNNGVLRISLMHYNTFQECDKIVNILKLFKSYKLNFQYSIDSTFKKNICDDLKSSFNELSNDTYYNNKRLRAFSLLKINNNDLEIMGNMNFYQSSNYNNFNGNKLRKYDNIQTNVLYNSNFIEIINLFKNYVENEYKDRVEYVQAHQIRVYCSKDNVLPVPEGIHRDGFNIVGIICINRYNINGGINIIYDNSQNLIHSVELKEGEMVILNDKECMHNVTEINLLNNNDEGFRDIFVFTTIS